MRTPLRSEVRRRLMDRMLRGDPAPGAGINEGRLAAELGVSRTPLREALLGLEWEGFVRTEPGRGFSVQPLTSREAEEIYPMLWTLEGLALRAGGWPRGQLAELERINARLGLAGGDAGAALECDVRWHRALLERCRNRSLLEAIAALKNRAYRYETHYMRDSGRVITSFTQHQAIASAIRSGDEPEALRLLEANWRVSLEFLEPWLRSGPARERKATQ
ncbi:MAG TPA: GntR family transcriptional regulator [Candidatus Limnocylindria bacterium]|nr:GntR family transcriptional regulator [Candidatus Limnocylindria bacterium]